MQTSTYRFFFNALFLLLVVVALTTISSCNKNEPSAEPPVITLVIDSGFVSTDTNLVIGGKIKIGIDAKGNERNITFFKVVVDNGSRQTLLDSGLNHPTLKYNLTIIKSQSSYEKWIFLVMDRDRNKDSVIVTISRSDSTSYGKIRTISDVVVSAQDNPVPGSFFAFQNFNVYDLQTAYENQDIIDLIYYFGQYDATLSSPGEAEAPGFFPGPYGVSGWTVKHETRYDTTALSMKAFDEAENDSLILAVYEPAAGKRKVKFIQPGMVVSFKSAIGKIGLIKVTANEPSTTGNLKFSIKIQE
jgi:hypothetical protein